MGNTKNIFLPVECISKITKRKNAKRKSIFDFSTLYIKISSDKLLDILYKFVDFVLKGGNRDYIVINKHGCASWSSKKREHHFVFDKSLLNKAILFFNITAFSLLKI